MPPLWHRWFNAHHQEGLVHQCEPLTKRVSCSTVLYVLHVLAWQATALTSQSMNSMHCSLLDSAYQQSGSVQIKNIRTFSSKFIFFCHCSCQYNKSYKVTGRISCKMHVPHLLIVVWWFGWRYFFAFQRIITCFLAPSPQHFTSSLPSIGCLLAVNLHIEWGLADAEVRSDLQTFVLRIRALWQPCCAWNIGLPF